jgi:hypothetical protein
LDILNTIDPYHEIYKKHNNGSIKEKLTSETPIILISFTAVPLDRYSFLETLALKHLLRLPLPIQLLQL